MAEDKVLLKKYPNRRLYDTEKSEYVSLDQLADLIRDGKVVEVVEVKTGEDVTAFTLTQIVLEKAKKKDTLLPVPFLHLIIRYGENVLAEFFEKYLEQMVKSYLSYKHAADDQFRKWLEVGQDFSSAARKTAENFTSLNPLLKSFSDHFSKNGKDQDG
jgi:polyhydroxyalkanoate synthesis repressor PhaR